MEALLGVAVERYEPSDEGRRSASFVCFGARGADPAIMWEMVSLAATPTRSPHDVPFVSVAVRAERAEPRPRRTVEALWEQQGSRFALTYTCVVVTDGDEIAARTTAKRGAIAALARVVSERLAALPSPA